MIKNIIQKYQKQGWLQQKDIEVLKKAGIVNWIGGKGACLEPIIEKILDLPYFDSDRYKELYQDIEVLSYWHDIDYYIPWNYIDFIKVNFIFSYRLYKLLNWTKWYARLWIAVLIFIVLQIYWKEYFNFSKK